MPDPYTVLGRAAGRRPTRRSAAGIWSWPGSSRRNTHPERFAAVRAAYEQGEGPGRPGPVPAVRAGRGRHHRGDHRGGRMSDAPPAARAEPAVNGGGPAGPLTPDAHRRGARRLPRVGCERGEPMTGGIGPPGSPEPVDLHTLVAQFTALRHEVNLQTKASRAAVEQTAEVLKLLDRPKAGPGRDRPPAGQGGRSTSPTPWPSRCGRSRSARTSRPRRTARADPPDDRSPGSSPDCSGRPTVASGRRQRRAARDEAACDRCSPGWPTGTP